MLNLSLLFFVVVFYGSSIVASTVQAKWVKRMPFDSSFGNPPFRLDSETKKVLLVVDRLESLNMNSLFRSSNAEKLAIRLGHLLPVTIITQMPTFLDDKEKFESLLQYVSQIYRNIDVSLIVSTLINRGFISIDENDSLNRLKISIILIALFKLKELSSTSPSFQSEMETSTVNIAEWAS